MTAVERMAGLQAIIAAARAEADQAAAAVAEVLSWHRQVGSICCECLQPYECRTIQRLRGLFTAVSKETGDG